MEEVSVFLELHEIAGKLTHRNHQVERKHCNDLTTLKNFFQITLITCYYAEIDNAEDDVDEVENCSDLAEWLHLACPLIMLQMKLKKSP